MAATYYDGRSAEGRAASVFAGADGLEIRLADADLLWPYGRLSLVSAADHGQRVVIAPRPGAAERLSLSGEDVLETLAAWAPQLRRQKPSRGHVRSVLVAGAIIAVLAVFWAGYPIVKQGIVAVFPSSWADRIGRSMAADNRLFGEPCDGAAGMAALEALSARLTQGMDLPEPVKVHVTASKDVNAFAAPGGHIVLLHGLIKEARSPDEVAGVLAHEIGHVQHRHPINRLVDVAGIQLIVTSISGDVGALGTLALMLSYGIDDEAEADRTGLDMLLAAGIAPDGLAAFFDRMARKNENKLTVGQFLRTHPPLEERSAMIRGRRPTGAVTPALTQQQWRDLRAVCDGVATEDEADEPNGGGDV
ncbi:M48 family metallopeptidase [Iodidimonas sp. SYSU 1G8]|uniref:M48 family metallopeptidase n=1 Tax=Iodidimonas sp. SYSU 1G8 TaxID=3133967 RepID=UPI0031FEB614